MNTKTLILSLSFLMMTAGLIPVANAETTTGKLQVKVTIGGPACSLKSGDNSVLDFGTPTDLSKDFPGQTDPSKGIEVLCSKDTKYRIGLTAGQNWKPNGGRQMAYNGSFIRYNLYKDSARKVLWGDINAPDLNISAIGTGAVVPYPVFGTIIAQAMPDPGQYSDLVVVQLIF